MRNRLYLIVLALVLLATAGLTAAASNVPLSQNLTTTPLPPREEATAVPAAPAAITPRLAQPPTVVQIGRIYEGNLNGDEASFLINAERGQFFLFDLSSDDFDPLLEIYDEHHTMIARDDDSGLGNWPQLLFIAPETAQFRLVVTGYSSPVTGGYILRVHGVAGDIAYGDTVTVEHDGLASKIFSLEAEEGDVINLYASTDDRIDTTLKLLGPDGAEIAYIDDYIGLDPELRRLPLYGAGRYYIIHAPYSSSAVGDVPLTLEKTESIVLSAEALEIELTASNMSDVYMLDVVEGRLYSITVSTSEVVYGTMELGNMSSSYGRVSLTFNDSNGASMLYRATATEQMALTVGIHSSRGFDSVIVRLSVRAAE